MEETEHKCKLAGKEFGGYVPNSRFSIKSWDVCFGGRVTGLFDHYDDGEKLTEPNLISHIYFCPYCGEKV